MLTIINQDNATIRAVNPRSWIKSTDYLQQEFQPTLQAYTVQCGALLQVLNLLKPKTRPVRQSLLEQESR